MRITVQSDGSTASRIRLSSFLKVILFSSLIILMITARTAQAFSGTSYNTMFNRTGCSTLGTDIQGRYEYDIGTGSFTTNEKGSQTGLTSHNSDGAFKFDNYAHGAQVNAGQLGLYYTGWEASVAFLKYEPAFITFSTLTAANGTSSSVHVGFQNATHSLTENFSSTSDELYIRIHQNSSRMWATYAFISGSGSTLANWTLSQKFDGSNLPPYITYNVNLAIAGLENTGYAVMHTGTDFQMESVIHPDVSDYTAHPSITWSGGAAGETGSCNNYETDDEGENATYTFGGSGTVSASHEAYEYMEVSG
jgi:hypothetical protein